MKTLVSILLLSLVVGCTPEEESPLPLCPPLPDAYYEGTEDGGSWYADANLLLDREAVRVRCKHQMDNLIDSGICGTGTIAIMMLEPSLCPMGCHDEPVGVYEGGPWVLPETEWED